jgi:hypothetical protein
MEHDLWLLSEENLAPPDSGDNAFGAFGPVSAWTGLPEDHQQQNFHVLVPPNPLQIQLAGQSVPPVIASTVIASTVIASTGDQAQNGGPIPLALPLPVPDDYSKPWENAEYAPLIQWVLAAPDADLIKPFGATVPAHLKPASWKSFRADDVDCSVNLGDQLSTISDTRIVLDAKNLFKHRYVTGMKMSFNTWMFMCPHCFVLGYAKSEKSTGPPEQFQSRSATNGKRQYTYICNSCTFKHQAFTAAKLFQKATEKAIHLDMDLYEYLLGDYEHVIDRIKSKFSNLEQIEKDHYDCIVKQTRRQNYEPFMGARIIETLQKAQKKHSQSPTVVSGLPLPLPQGMSNLSVRLPVASKRTAGPSARMPRKARKQPSGSEVQVTMNTTQTLYPELQFWKIMNKKFKLEIDSGTLTKEVFERICLCRDFSCEFIDSCVMYSYQKGDRFSVQDGEMNDYDYVVRNCNKAIARLFSNPDLVSPELKDDCMDALGFGDEEIAALLSKPLPSAQPADMSETNLRVVPRQFDEFNALYQLTKDAASPSVRSAYSPPAAGFLGVFGARKSPLAGASFSTGVSTISHSVPNQFKPVRDPSYEEEEMPNLPPLLPSLSLAPAASLSLSDRGGTSSGGGTSSNETNCICAKAPSSDRLIQCCLCTQWSHRICYSIDTDDDIKDWCCMHCKPMVYNNLTEGIKCPITITGLSSKLACMCSVYYPCPSAVPGTDIDYDDTNWLRCNNGSCGRVMHSKCYQSHPNHKGIRILCWQCVDDDDDDDDDDD